MLKKVKNFITSPAFKRGFVEGYVGTWLVVIIGAAVYGSVFGWSRLIDIVK